MKKGNNIYEKYYDNILDIQEAPEEYSLTDDEINYYISENFEEIDNIKRGDIVFVTTYAYSSGEIGKNHLFVIIDKNKFISFEYFGMIISSNLKKSTYKYNYKINSDNNNNLNKDSIVKTDCIYKLRGENIKFIVGHLDENIINIFEEKYEEYLNEKN